MFNINQLLEKVRGLRNSDIGLRLAIQAAIKSCIGVEIPAESIQVKSSKVSFKNISSAVKSEIFMKKEKILESIKLTTGKDITVIG